MLLLSHLRTLFTVLFVAVVIAACGGSSGGAGSGEVNNPSVEESPLLDTLGAVIATPPRRLPLSTSTDFSPDEFRVNILKPHANSAHSNYRKVENYISGESLTFRILSSVTIEGVYITDLAGIPLQGTNFSLNTDMSANDLYIYQGSFVVPLSDFRIGLVRFNPDGSTIEKILPELYELQALNIGFSSSKTLRAGEVHTINLDISNVSQRGAYTITVMPSEESLISPQTVIVELEEGEQWTSSFDIFVPENMPRGFGAFSIKASIVKNDDSSISGQSIASFIVI